MQVIHLHSSHEPPRSTRKLPPSAWVIVAAFREARRIGAVLEGLLSVASNIVVVDDGSDDGTYRVVLQYPVWTLRHVVNLGQGAALQTGIRFALARGARYVATFDADGQHDPGDLLRMYEVLKQTGADVVLGSRFAGSAPGMPWSRRLLLKAATWFTRTVSGVRVTDTHNGIRFLTRNAAERIEITMNRMAHASEILHQIAQRGLRYVEIPVTIRYTSETLHKGQRAANAITIAAEVLGEQLVK